MGADQVASILPAIDELEDAAGGPGPECFAKFDVPGRDGVWVEVALGTVSLSDPFLDPPNQRLRSSQVVELPGLALEDWRPGVFASFAYDPATPSRRLAEFIDQIMGGLAGMRGRLPDRRGDRRVVLGVGRRTGPA